MDLHWLGYTFYCIGRYRWVLARGDRYLAGHLAWQGRGCQGPRAVTEDDPR
jgi:hypothetical protein